MSDQDPVREAAALEGAGTLWAAGVMKATVQYRLMVPVMRQAVIRGTIMLLDGRIPDWHAPDLILELNDGRRMPIRIDPRGGRRGRFYRVTERAS